MSILEASHRIVVVSRKFWPWVDDASLRLLCMVEGLRSRGVEANVLTGRWHATWPEHAVLRGAQVNRLLPPPKSNWNEGHFQKNVLMWLRANLDHFDSIYVDRADGLLNAIVAKANRWNKPVIARFALDSDTQGIARGQCLTPTASADCCRRCDHVITPSPFAHRFLISQGIHANRIERIPDWVGSNVNRTAQARSAASAALFQTSSDFVVPGRTDLILHYGNTEPKALLVLTHAVCDLLDQGASVRMWVVGCGSNQPEVYESIRDRGWHREILLFDGFDDLEELTAVADLAIVSNPDAGLQFSALMFLNSELPMILADNMESRSWFAQSQPVKLYGNGGELRDQLRDWQMHRQQWITEAIALRVHADSHRPTPRKCLDQWEKLLKPLSIESRG